MTNEQSCRPEQFSHSCSGFPTLVAVSGENIDVNSSNVMTFAYLASMSKRFAAWAKEERSKQPSSTRNTLKPWEKASITEALTHPEVETPTTTSVSTCF